jgi:hypothetical protein
LADGAPPPATGTVRQRRVYYVCGIDPRGARFYHAMWREEAAKQKAVDGREYVVGDADEEGPLTTAWTVRARVDGQETVSRHVYLRWDDLMRAYWPSRSSTLLRLPGIYARHLRSGLLARTWRHGRGFFWAYFLTPVIYLLLTLLLVGGGAWAAATLAAASGADGRTAWLAAAAAAALLLWLCVANADHIRLFWLCRTQVFMEQWAMREPPSFAQRWQAFAQRIEDDLRRDVASGDAPDEVLLVAHCGGAPAAVQIAATWLAMHRPAPGEPQLKLLTLGQAIPLVGLAPGAARFRDQLLAVGRSGLPWLDMTAPADLLCYALANPFTACGLEMPAQAGYRLKSSRFDLMFPPPAYSRLRKDIFRTHFQYLMASALPVDNDWFQLTCGPAPLPVPA